MSFAEKIKKFFSIPPRVSDEYFEDLSDLLVEGDFGAAEAYSTVEALRDNCKKQKISEGEEVRSALAEILERQLLTGAQPPASGSLSRTEHAVSKENNLKIVLLLGVNGVGKTTTAAKLARRFRDENGKEAPACRCGYFSRCSNRSD
jgi:fused signal recognition particle receptor